MNKPTLMIQDDDLLQALEEATQETDPTDQPHPEEPTWIAGILRLSLAPLQLFGPSSSTCYEPSKRLEPF